MHHSMTVNRALIILFALAVLTYGVGDVLSTFLALNFDHNNTEGLSVTANILSSGFGGYAILLGLKVIGLVVFLAMAAYGWRSAAGWSILGFVIYGSYLTASNLSVFLFGFPLLPPGDPRFMLGFIWTMVLPFLATGLVIEAIDAYEVLTTEKQGYGIWGRELKKLKTRFFLRHEAL